ncbi:ATP-binding protein [Streptomyces sp. AK02-04a]|uniref:ATP-binding protein n=1 Tax=Streptomyces sp. AK02-04a TaxID=3028649 RepID=UPI0029BA3EAF|nr:ATP-binding protein [Streptomyces sp. AK02-04a]MDX3763027.1 ATP-binding protein [Streptomyces sp. AK02-04a]
MMTQELNPARSADSGRDAAFGIRAVIQGAGVSRTEQAGASLMRLHHSEARPASAGQWVSIILRAEPQSVSVARACAADALRMWGIDLDSDVVATARLLVSELFTNAVIHSDASMVELALTVSGTTLHVEVADNGTPPPELPEISASAVDEHGRGLLLVRELAESWGRLEGRRTGVWIDLSLTPC